MISKKRIAILLIIGIVLSFLTVSLTMIRPPVEEEQVYSNSASSSGKVSFYVKEKLEPKTGKTTVKFNVIE